jgi:TRAP-type C4-dicarboxylate transport system substrate-binding protein
LAALPFMTACPSPEPKETVSLRLVIPSPAGDMLTVKDEELAARFNERAEGYEMKVYPGETLAKIAEYLDAVRTGAVEIMDVGWGTYSGAEPRFGGNELPFLYNNIRAQAASQDDLVKIADPIFQEKFNQKALASFSTGAFELISVKPVTTLEEWSGVMVGAINPPLANMTTELGGAPVIVMWPELYTNLEKGVIDAGMLSTTGMIQLKLTDIAGYVTIFFGATGANGYTINLDIWNAMPKKIQDILLEETKQTAETMNAKFIQLRDEDVETLTSMGMNVYVLPETERARWKDACFDYTEEELSKLGEFGQKIKQIADKVNAENP